MKKTTYLKSYHSSIDKNVSSFRKSIMTILIRDLSSIKGKRVLEIGCGKWDFAKKIFEKNGNEWIGLEPVDLGRENMTIFKGSVKKMPFHSNSFDYVLCNQTMEHWFEYNVSLKEALREIHRVLKPGGVFMANSPIHLHGDPRFLMGEIKKINSQFKSWMWNVILLERVVPIEKKQRWKQISGKGFLSKVGYPSFLIKNSKNAFTYLINIHAKKKGGMIPVKNPKNMLRWATVIIRFFKTYILTRFF